MYNQRKLTQSLVSLVRKIEQVNGQLEDMGTSQAPVPTECLDDDRAAGQGRGTGGNGGGVCVWGGVRTCFRAQT